MSRDEIEQAFRTLNLPTDATPKDVVEARDRLVAQWDPDRLPSYSGLREKAESKIAEIGKAFDTLIAATGGTSEKSSPTTVRQDNSRSVAETPSHEDKPGASLFDEVFSAQQRRQGVPVLLLAGAVLTVVLGLFLLWPASPPESNDAASSAPQIERPLPASPGPESPLIVAGAGPAADGKPATEPPPSEPPSAGNQRAERPPATQRSAVPKPPPPSAAVTEPPPEPATRRQPEPDAPPAPEPRPRREPAMEAAPPTVPPEEHQDQSSSAFLSLLESSTAARQLTTGGVSGYHFLEWKMVQEKGREIWIDILARDAGGLTVHFIWSINLENSQTVPLSQAARNLERGG